MTSLTPQPEQAAVLAEDLVDSHGDHRQAAAHRQGERIAAGVDFNGGDARRRIVSNQHIEDRPHAGKMAQNLLGSRAANDRRDRSA